MKIGILTHYDVNNQGAQLQLYALSKYLQDMGHTVVILSYKKNYDFIPELEKRNQISISSIPYIIKNFLIAKGLRLTWHNVRKYITNKRFREKTFNCESYCLADIDAAIVGADEVFSLELGVNMMMFGHGVNTNNMISYAPSCGQTDLSRMDKFHCRNLIEAGLKHFIALSARDINTKNIMETLTGRTVAEVCDPVLLYEFPLNAYNRPTQVPKCDYMVVYSYDARFVNPHEIEAVKTFAKKHKLKIVSPGTFHKWCDINIVCNALEWLKCVESAKFVVTDTFHGIIAAAITNRPMALYYSKEVNSSKILDLVDRLGVDNRMMQNVTFEEIERLFNEKQDMDLLNKRICKMRIASKQYLVESLDKVTC